MKRLIGLQYTDPRATAELALCPFTAVPNPSNGGVAVKVNYENEEKIVPIELATGMMVGHMNKIASANNAGQAVQDWVIGVPAWYSDQQKRSFLDACEIVGVNCLRLMHER
jgi:heat shock protein 4